MIYNMNQNYNENLKDVAYYDTRVKGDRTYGIWIFRCGEFKNEGSRGWEHWAFMHPCYHRYAGGNGVRFESDQCSDSSWRQTNKC